MMFSKNDGSLPDDRAHAISTTATAAAARITSAYSAVVCPISSRSRICARTNQRSPMAPPLEPSADLRHGGDQDRHHREEEERGEDEEHAGEEHLHGGGARAFDRTRPPFLANIRSESRHLVRERRPESLGPNEKPDRALEVGEPEALARRRELVAPPRPEIRIAQGPLELVRERSFDRLDRPPHRHLR